MRTLVPETETHFKDISVSPANFQIIHYLGHGLYCDSPSRILVWYGIMIDNEVA